MAAPFPQLSLAEWLVLCLIREAPAHGFALARTLSEEGELGKIWRVPKPVIYRALQRLEDAGLVATVELQPSNSGPVRSLVDATDAGKDAAAAWLAQPARHNRDIRSELLAKLALLNRAGADPADLLAAQRAQLEPVAEALHRKLDRTTGFDRTVVLWRWEMVVATLRFLDDAVSEPATEAQAR
ncbi:MAG TPA: PadR family transcriptional regulator [Streptosporangiaceae bacterium]|nr:PadR family transcriptional regulator [Streptosporangiaceae bacterium]